MRLRVVFFLQLGVRNRAAFPNVERNTARRRLTTFSRRAKTSRNLCSSGILIALKRCKFAAVYLVR
jgi:hypothetical protein